MTRSARRSPTHRLAVILLVGAVALALAACSTATGRPVPPSATAPAGTAAASPAACPTSPPAPMPAGQTATVAIQTAKGTITIKVEGSLGPNAAGNFVALARCGYYDGVIFHRLVPGFVLQGGDGQYGREPNVDSAHVGQGGPGYQFDDDPVNVPYTRGTVAMANSGANTNGSQFFIVLADAQLPPSYSVFGHVTAGMDVVDTIAAMPNSGSPDNMALQPVAMTRLTVTSP